MQVSFIPGIVKVLLLSNKTKDDTHGKTVIVVK
jgi:hypothetical protein